MRVLLADDQAEVRSAIRLVVEQLVGYSVAGEAVDAPGLLSACEELRPDVVLLDWELPGARRFLTDEGWGFGALTALRVLAPGVRVVALSARPHLAGEVLDAGADAFVCKGDPPRKLIDALDRLWA